MGSDGERNEFQKVGAQPAEPALCIVKSVAMNGVHAIAYAGKESCPSTKQTRFGAVCMHDKVWVLFLKRANVSYKP